MHNKIVEDNSDYDNDCFERAQFMSAANALDKRFVKLLTELTKVHNREMHSELRQRSHRASLVNKKENKRIN